MQQTLTKTYQKGQRSTKSYQKCTKKYKKNSKKEPKVQKVPTYHKTLPTSHQQKTSWRGLSGWDGGAAGAGEEVAIISAFFVLINVED